MQIGITNNASHEPISLDGVTVAPGVVETIVALAAAQTKGVAGVCGRSALRKKRVTAPAVDVELIEGGLYVEIHLIVTYGFALTEVGKNVQHNVAVALDGQMGIVPAHIDVFIDGIEFEG